jgi:putative cardiolipin synthase
VQGLSATFDDYWNSEVAIPAQAIETISPSALSAYRAQLAQHRQALKEDGLSYVKRVASGEPLASLLSGALPLVWAKADIICDSPEKARIEKGEMVGQLMHRAVARSVEAVQSELLMVSPYLIPGDEGMRLFRELGERKAKMRILTNSLASTNVLTAHAGYTHYRIPLLEAGAELYEVRALLGSARGSGQPKSMTQFGTYSLHAKWFVFDRKKLFIGSMNFDQRSMHLNTEVGLLIDSPELARQAATRFEAIVQPANSYHVILARTADGGSRLVWRTEENGQRVDYDEEPAHDDWQKFRVRMLSLLPLDNEL